MYADDTTTIKRAGATAVRRSAFKTIMANGYVDVIKGNEGEIRAVFGDDKGIQQRGVDSSSTLSEAQRAELVRKLAARENNIVVMTGKTDFVSDGCSTYAISNGHEYLGMVTGTGCVLGTTISAMIAVCDSSNNIDFDDKDKDKKNKLKKVIAGILLFEIAAEIAAERPDVQGPGTFVPAFIDTLSQLRKTTAASSRGRYDWISRARISRQ
jgi:thiamine-phosphate diphosphorylase/hydroxyethylthiazole kinase